MLLAHSFALLMSVRGKIKKRKLHQLQLIGLAVLSEGTVYPGKKSHKRKMEK